jgi:hypothetical protein
VPVRDVRALVRQVTHFNITSIAPVGDTSNVMQEIEDECPLKPFAAWCVDIIQRRRHSANFPQKRVRLLLAQQR